MKDKSHITILTVSWHSQSFLKANHDLLLKLNPNKLPASWIIVENTPLAGEKDYHDVKRSIFKVVQSPYGGVEHPKDEGSYQHGYGLNFDLASVKTRYVAIMDPDFFVIRPNWVNDIEFYMKERGLSFFGVPWHPKWLLKYRYFPAVHFIVIDLKIVPLDNLDFLPNLERRARMVGHHWNWLIDLCKSRRYRSAIGYFIGYFLDLLHEEFMQREALGSSKDTGYQIFRKFSNRDEYKREILKPYFDPKRTVFYPNCVTAIQKKYFDILYPRQRRFIPPKTYYIKNNFFSYGYPDCAAYGWEEFFWKSLPFGFHIRQNERKMLKQKIFIDDLYLILERCISKSESVLT